MQQQAIWWFSICFTRKAPIHHNLTPTLQIIVSQDTYAYGKFPKQKKRLQEEP